MGKPIDRNTIPIADLVHRLLTTDATCDSEAKRLGIPSSTIYIFYRERTTLEQRLAAKARKCSSAKSEPLPVGFPEIPELVRLVLVKGVPVKTLARQFEMTPQRFRRIIYRNTTREQRDSAWLTLKQKRKAEAAAKAAARVRKQLPSYVMRLPEPEQLEAERQAHRERERDREREREVPQQPERSIEESEARLSEGRRRVGGGW